MTHKYKGGINGDEKLEKAGPNGLDTIVTVGGSVTERTEFAEVGNGRFEWIGLGGRLLALVDEAEKDFPLVFVEESIAGQVSVGAGQEGHG